jgi:hypothetical protein
MHVTRSTSTCDVRAGVHPLYENATHAAPAGPIVTSATESHDSVCRFAQVSTRANGSAFGSDGAAAGSSE